MQYHESYKLQLNIEISSSDMLEILTQITPLLNNLNETCIPASSSDVSPETFETEIVSTMHEIGVPAHIMGYRYLKDAILITLNNKEAIHSITKFLYPEIAAKNHTTPSRVERAIRHAIEIAFTRGNSDFINSLFGYSINPNTGKPTNSEFIAIVSDYLCMKHL